MKKIMFNDKYGLTQAVLEGRKTQTRRIAHITKHQFELVTGVYDEAPKELIQSILHTSSIFKVGEIVAIAQSYRDCGGLMEDGTPRWDYISAIVGAKSAGWTNKMFTMSELMPHKISITNVRIQRLQDISDEDCLKEGIVGKWHAPAGKNYYYVPNIEVKSVKDVYNTPREAFAELIGKVSGKGTWDSNPYVFVYEFEFIK